MDLRELEYNMYGINADIKRNNNVRAHCDIMFILTQGVVAFEHECRSLSTMEKFERCHDQITRCGSRKSGNLCNLPLGPWCSFDVRFSDLGK